MESHKRSRAPNLPNVFNSPQLTSPYEYKQTIYKKLETEESSDAAVLDLSYKVSAQPDSNTESDNNPSTTSHESSYSKCNQTDKEINNNCVKDCKRVKETKVEKVREAQSYNPGKDEQENSNSSTSSNDHGKYSIDSRFYIMTPPSESTSPKALSHFDTANYPFVPFTTNILIPPPTYTVAKLENSTLSLPRQSVYQPFLHQPSVVPVTTQVNQLNPILLTHSTSETPQEAAISAIMTSGSAGSDESKKIPRPFKAYPKDPLALTLGPNLIFDQELKKAYTDFRSRMLDSVKKTNEGTNIKMRRTSKSPMPSMGNHDEKDAAYWERRRKNNEAAKRSRDARRAKEDEIAIRAAFWEQECSKMKFEIQLLKEENERLKAAVYGKG